MTGLLCKLKRWWTRDRRCPLCGTALVFVAVDRGYITPLFFMYKYCPTRHYTVLRSTRRSKKLETFGEEAYEWLHFYNDRQGP